MKKAAAIEEAESGPFRQKLFAALCYLGESPMLATSATTSSMNLSVAAGKASARAVARRGGGTHACRVVWVFYN